MAGEQLTLAKDGAALLPALAADLISSFGAALEDLPSCEPGVRIVGNVVIAELLSSEHAVGAHASRVLGQRAMPVRAILFNKSLTANWGLRWHQDRVIVVRERKQVTGFKNWSVKSRALHVEPPAEVLARMLTARIHLDDVDQGKGVLEVILGSHALGRVDEASIDVLAAPRSIRECPASAGDVWFYRTPIIHRSAPSRVDRPRRVLQVDYSADALPGGLEWCGV